MKRAALFLLSTFLLLLLVAARADEEMLQGFTPQSSAQEREWEAKYKAIPNPDNQREYMRRLTAHPHHRPSGKRVQEQKQRSYPGSNRGCRNIPHSSSESGVMTATLQDRGQDSRLNLKKLNI